MRRSDHRIVVDAAATDVRGLLDIFLEKMRNDFDPSTNGKNRSTRVPTIFFVEEQTGVFVKVS
jgi:hypothetical protein